MKGTPKTSKRRPAKAADDWQGMNWIRQDKRLAIYIRDGFRCGACGRNLKNAAPGELTLDHIVPRSKGGGNEATNVITSCRSCNCARKAKSFRKFYGDRADKVLRMVERPLNRKLAKDLLKRRAA